MVDLYNLIKNDPCQLEFIEDDQTNELCELAVSLDGSTLEYVVNQTEKICEIAVMEYGFALRHVKNQTYNICKLALAQNPQSFKFVKNKTFELCKIALSLDKSLLDCVNKDTLLINEYDELVNIATSN